MSFFWYAMDSLTSQLKAECGDKSVLFLWDLTSTLFLEQYSYWNNCHLFNILAAIFSKFWWIFLEVVVLLCVCSLRVSQWQIKGNLYIDFFFFLYSLLRDTFLSEILSSEFSWFENLESVRLTLSAWPHFFCIVNWKMP